MSLHDCGIVGNVGTRFWKVVKSHVALQSTLLFFITDYYESKSLINMHYYISHYAPWPLCDITGGRLSDYMLLFGARKGFRLLFFTYPVVLLKTYKHTFMCQIGGVTL